MQKWDRKEKNRGCAGKIKKKRKEKKRFSEKTISGKNKKYAKIKGWIIEWDDYWME
ncbi:hypothetical protein [Methanosarcina lacustris]|uniref:hypothetical protein n=1 Tax=Methanosarcina lacustris TaxID=170861 RepID=UPI000A971AEC|nr:hypothetical protein [Methanosarcina lacustris]